MNNLKNEEIQENKEIEVEETFGKFFQLLDGATRNGGIFVSLAGGTANVMAGELSRGLGIEYKEAHSMLDKYGMRHYGEENWYAEMGSRQPYNVLGIKEEDFEYFRFDIPLIVKTAIKYH